MNTAAILKDLYLLKRNLRKSPAEIRILQRKKLNKILLYAYGHSSYYHEKFMTAGITEEKILKTPLSDFPSIDKITLLSRFEEVVTIPGIRQENLRTFEQERGTKGKYLGHYHVVHSSGSTEMPGYFLYDEAAWQRMLAAIIRAALWNLSMGDTLKLLLKSPKVAYIAATNGRYGGAMAVGDGINGVGARQLFLDINMPLTEWTEKIQSFKPDIIIGYPSAIKILGDLVIKGEISLNLLRVITCGEPLDRRLRQYFEAVFQTEVFNFYGAGESLALGVEKDPSDGIFLFDDMNVVESVNGNMYLTSLYNFTQPLIRYRLSDCLKLEPADPRTEIPFTRAIGLIGRDEDILWFRKADGSREFLHPLAVEGFCLEGLIDYQFRKTGETSFVMLAEVPDKKQRDLILLKMENEMKQILQEKDLGNISFSVRFTDFIKPDPKTGKKKLIIAG